ncbi:hypothetical protein EB118_10680 [bacterium]|nr:hypothetical protein [bacterium]NDD83198.1 hypothetical protein [bacterium]NDG30522.1 hypothetical protein [bacterium]
MDKSNDDALAQGMKMLIEKQRAEQKDKTEANRSTYITISAVTSFVMFIVTVIVFFTFGITILVKTT